jgi:glycolate oxidase FAD binding subunit
VSTAPSDPILSRLIERVNEARLQRVALEIRGAGSKAFYGNAPVGEALDVTPLSGISSYEPSELVVTARAGTPLAELEAALAEQGQCLPFEPPRFALPGDASRRGGTVGGMVAAGLAGPARASVGSVRDYVLGASLLNGRAELLSFGGQVMKNVAGYDVSRLLAGSMGILGVICEVSLKVLPQPVASVTLRFERDQASAIEQLQQLGGLPLPLHASAWWDGMLVLRLSGAAAAVQSATSQLGGEQIAPALADTFWTGLRDQTDEFFVGATAAVSRGARLWRLSVPAGAPPIRLAGEQLIEWGGAQRWVCSPVQPQAVREAAHAAGGHATLFRGAKTDCEAFAPLSAALERIHRQLKTAFDPDAVFNPGRLYAGW